MIARRTDKMLNIPLIKFKSNFKVNRNQIIGRYNSSNNTSLKNTKLAPLAKDTVTFSGVNAKLNRSLFEAFDNIDICTQVRDDAKPAMNDLKNTLETALAPLMATKDNPRGIIDSIHTRIKSPDSIREKAADKLEAAITSATPWAFNPKTAEGIKGVLGDIVGARIVLRKSDIKQTSEIIDILANLVRQGKLKITKIQNYVPANAQLNLKYFKDSDLEKLKDAVNSKRGPNEKPLEVIYEAKGTGYMALHLDVDLSNPEYKAWNNDYKGEIQILGYDVAKLKDLEDYCYKMKPGKDIKGGYFPYQPLSTHFHKLYNNTAEYPNIKEDFDTYTSRAYLIQRSKEPLSPEKKKKKNMFPTIEECGLKGKLPNGLDFNVLNGISQSCDKTAEIINSAA